MKGTQAIACLLAALVAGAAWWGFSGAERGARAQEPQVTIVECKTGTPVGTRSGNTVTLPAETKEFCVYWKTAGSGDGASLFRVCELTGNETTRKVGVFSTSTCQGDVGFPARDGEKYTFKLSYESAIPGAKNAGGSSLSGERGMDVVIGASPSSSLPGGGQHATGTLPGTVSPPKPEYREL